MAVEKSGVKPRTVADVAELFPDRSFMLLRVERGDGAKRKLVWFASWGAGYFTSDSDRLVGVGAGAGYVGETPELALGAMVFGDLVVARERVATYSGDLTSAEAELESLAVKLGEPLE